MKPSTLITSLIGDRPRVLFVFGDDTEEGITDPFYDPKRRGEYFSEGVQRHSLVGLGLPLDQQKMLIPGLCAHLILRTRTVFADRDCLSKDLNEMTLTLSEVAKEEEVEWEHSHGFCNEEEQRLAVKRVFRKLKERFSDDMILHEVHNGGGSSNIFPARRGDRFVLAFFSLIPAPIDVASALA